GSGGAAISSTATCASALEALRLALMALTFSFSSARHAGIGLVSGGGAIRALLGNSTNVNLWMYDLVGMWNVGIVDSALRHWETHVRNHGISLLMHLLNKGAILVRSR